MWIDWFSNFLGCFCVIPVTPTKIRSKGCTEKHPAVWTLSTCRPFVAWKPIELILTDSNEAHLPTPWYGQYLTHAYNHITRAVAAMDSCFALVLQIFVTRGKVLLSLHPSKCLKAKYPRPCCWKQAFSSAMSKIPSFGRWWFWEWTQGLGLTSNFLRPLPPPPKVELPSWPRTNALYPLLKSQRMAKEGILVMLSENAHSQQHVWWYFVLNIY